MPNRRDFLKTAALVAATPLAYAKALARESRVLVNDIHSRLNPTFVQRVIRADSQQTLHEMIGLAAKRDKQICIAGGRHAMGAQQFGTETWMLDTRDLDQVLEFDPENGTVTVEAGIQWPELIRHLLRTQQGQDKQWGIIQKQTGADRLSIGGALAANAHGRVLTRKPFIGDVEALTLINSSGELVRCSRDENSELFRLVIGGYGLFGVIYSVTLRLTPRTKVERFVEVREMDTLPEAFDKRISEGFLYGDCQFAIDGKSDDFLKKGVFSCYRPVPNDTPIPSEHKHLSDDDWRDLLRLAHTDKTKAFDSYVEHYLRTDGQVYWSDTHQMAFYQDDYHGVVDVKLEADKSGSEMITEVYCPRDQLPGFMAEVADDFRRNSVDVVYGTIRLIEKDDESFLPWARTRYACVIFNLHVEHTEEGIATAAESFRRVIDIAISRGGSYFLTYHKWARRDQVASCYPQFAEFLELKRKYDPEGRFQSDWYRHHVKMFG